MNYHYLGDKIFNVLLLLLVLACVLGNCTNACEPAVAQIRPAETPVIILARALVAEVDDHFQDYFPMLAVYESRAARVQGHSWNVARAYARIYRTRPEDYDDRLRVIATMPGVIPANRENDWELSTDHTTRWLNGERSYRCWLKDDPEKRQVTPTHFGDAHGDRRRAMLAQWEEIVCEWARQCYWREQQRNRTTRQ